MEHDIKEEDEDDANKAVAPFEKGKKMLVVVADRDTLGTGTVVDCSTSILLILLFSHTNTIHTTTQIKGTIDFVCNMTAIKQSKKEFQSTGCVVTMTTGVGGGMLTTSPFVGTLLVWGG